jgi:hypothetical protein
MSAGTVPAGTTVVLRTMNPIGSHERVGRTFRAKLDHDLAARGQVLLSAGTVFTGHVEASRGGGMSHSSPLTLDLTSVNVGGHKMSVKTTGAVQPEPPGKTARQVRSGVTVGESTFVIGTRLQFTLAEPLKW